MTARPESVGIASDRLARIDRFLASRYIGPGLLPHAVMLIHRRGETVHFSAQGQMDVERGRAADKDTLFRIYSMTKPLTSAALMMLFEEGAFQLDDPVHKYIPEWAGLQVFKGGIWPDFAGAPVGRPMQIVDLLRHTSGLTYGFQFRTNVDAAYRQLKVGELTTQGTLDGMIAALAGLPLEFSPGEHWNYSVSTDVCGYLVGKLSAMPFERFLKERLLDPLGMADTDFHVREGEAKRLAACYHAPSPGRMALQDDPAKSAYLAPPSFISGGGGLVSTAADYLRFCRMMLNKGSLDGVRYLSPKTVELMTANHLPGGKSLSDMSVSMFSEAANAGIGFGLGFAVTQDPAASLIPGSAGEFYWGGAASTAFWIDPREDLIVIFMTQLLPSSRYNIRRELRTLVYSTFMD